MMISVIIAAYNASRYLEKCLSSVLGQTYRELEIIAVNDGSTDKTLEIMEHFAANDSRVKVISQENRGASAARNLGISAANGELITFVDADDWLNEEHIERLTRGMTKSEADCCVCGYRLEFPDGSTCDIAPEELLISAGQAVEDMLFPNKFQGFLWNKLFKASIIRDNNIRLDESLHYMEDLLFCAEYFGHCGKVSCISNIGCHYRQHADSITCKRRELDAAAISKRETAVSALENVLKYCSTEKARRLCKAKVQTEYAEMLKSVSPNGENSATFKKYKREIRRGLPEVLSSPLPLKQKVKQTGTALFPKSVSRYLNKRQSGRFRRR